MKNIIKKILREEFDWIDQEVSGTIIVTTENVCLGCKVKLRETSDYYNQAPEVVGTIVIDPDYIDMLYWAGADAYWTSVKWDDEEESFNVYKIGGLSGHCDECYDLEFVL
jgi:hypothetical protein